MTGLNKTTLSRHIRAGRLSAQRVDGGGYLIDASELARVYELRPDATGTRPEARSDARPDSDPLATLPATADALVAELRAQLAQSQATVEDLRARLDASETRLDRLLLSLPSPATVAPALAAPPRPGFLTRLLGRT
jgi:hypothetical protein